MQDLHMFSVLLHYVTPLVTYCATKLIETCSPMIGEFLDTMILASSDKGLLNLLTMKVLETVLSYPNLHVHVPETHCTSIEGLRLVLHVSTLLFNKLLRPK